jgi:hypothetical protein
MAFSYVQWSTMFQFRCINIFFPLFQFHVFFAPDKFYVVCSSHFYSYFHKMLMSSISKI